MFEELTRNEKEIMSMLIRGQNFNGISDWLGIDYEDFVKTKRSLFKKLKITRATHLLHLVLKSGFSLDDL